MTPYIQLIKHDPENGQYGDCYRTAIACLLDIPPEEVPHVIQEDDWKERTVAWLNTKGYSSFCFGLPSVGLDYKTVLEWVSKNSPGVYFLFMGCGLSGANHYYLAIDGKIAHDPSGRNGVPVGPCDDGYYWVEILVPLKVCK